MHPSLWYLLTALFWFPWIWSTAAVLLTCVPVRGMMQPVVAWWFGAQLHYVWFGLVGLAALWYVLPRAAERPLHSRYLALLAFWTLVLFGGWRGMPQGAPLPAWMPAVGTVASMLTVAPLIAVALNLHGTVAGRYGAAAASRSGFLALLGAGAYLVAMVLGVVASWPGVSRVTELTFFMVGVDRLLVVGFLGAAVFAVLYDAAPGLLRGLLPSRTLARIHVACWSVGLLVQSAAFLGFGVLQGRALNDHAVPFLEALKPGLMALRMGTLGDLLLVAGAGALVCNMAWGCVQLFKVHVLPGLRDVVREVPAEATR
jgi:cytochrome c oxidase cbb3-type subunit 1